MLLLLLLVSTRMYAVCGGKHHAWHSNCFWPSLGKLAASYRTGMERPSWPAVLLLRASEAVESLDRMEVWLEAWPQAQSCACVTDPPMSVLREAVPHIDVP